ncbi:MAG: hypothetical protein V1925_01405 [Candidatus Omnitrophota bacterium]
MDKRKPTGITISVIGSAISLFSLGVFSLYILWPVPKIIQAIHYFSHKLFLSLPAIMVPICATVMLIFGLFCLLIALPSLPAIMVPICATVMLIFGLFSLLLGLDFFMHPLGYLELLRFFLPLIFISGIVYSFSCVFLFKLKHWSRNIVIIWSVIPLFYFIPNVIYLFFDPWGWGKMIAFSFFPYIFFPSFFIIFLTRKQVKELFKK